MIYHEGELAVQERAGVRRQAERIGAGIHPSVPPARSWTASSPSW